MVGGGPNSEKRGRGRVARFEFNGAVNLPRRQSDVDYYQIEFTFYALNWPANLLESAGDVRLLCMFRMAFVLHPPKGAHPLRRADAGDI